MNSTSDDVITRLRKMVSEAYKYFTLLNEANEPGPDYTLMDDGRYRPRRLVVPEQLKGQSDVLANELVLLGQEIVVLCRNSPFVTDVEARLVPILVRKMRSAVMLQRYTYTPAKLVYGEDGVVSTEPSTQYTFEFSQLDDAWNAFMEAHKDLEAILPLMDQKAGPASEMNVQSEPANKYRPNTAFIMMWMNREQPELEDVRDTVRDVFNKFGIRAVRADDIEHEGLITQKILDEIRTSEFLFADLTGERPSVYYEVGYAHALPKRVILFRKAGTKIHFDLAGYNCPEYENLRDLREQLNRRLEAVTGKHVQ